MVSSDTGDLVDSVPTSVIYGLIRKLDRLDNIVEQLASKGIILPEELTHADLSATLAHAERIVKIRVKAGLDSSDIEEASIIIRRELKGLQIKLELERSS